jgi:HAD superfamily hydrolase (TIGR01509 family)
MKSHTPTAVLFDVDGTLIDSNDAHAHAWVAAFAEHGIAIDFTQTRRCIGMGGDKLMPEVSGIGEDSVLGTAIAERRSKIFAEQFLPHLRPFKAADRLVAELKARGYTIVAASSARREELQSLLTVAGADALMDANTSSDDATNSKPDPDIVQAALKRANASPTDAVMVGDTPYDVEASLRAGVASIAFRCGGWADHDLKGAIAIYDGPWDLLSRLEHSPLGGS